MQQRADVMGDVIVSGSSAYVVNFSKEANRRHFVGLYEAILVEQNQCTILGTRKVSQ